jgi:hypothetical protein
MTVLDRVIQVASYSQGLGLQVAIRLDPIHEIAGIGLQLLRVEIVQVWPGRTKVRAVNT